KTCALAGRITWHFLREMGHFPATVPATMRAAAIRGQRTITEMVDRHRIRNLAVRDLLIDYITRRSPELDYASIEGLARDLAGYFWARIERINPDQQNLQLPDHAAGAGRGRAGRRSTARSPAGAGSPNRRPGRRRGPPGPPRYTRAGTRRAPAASPAIVSPYSTPKTPTSN